MLNYDVCTVKNVFKRFDISFDGKYKIRKRGKRIQILLL